MTDFPGPAGTQALAALGPSADPDHVLAILREMRGELAERLGIDLNCTHHRSATDGLVTAVSTPIHVGRTICTFDIVISDEQQRRICSARLTVMLRDLSR